MQTVSRPPIYATTLHGTEAARATKHGHERDHVAHTITWAGLEVRRITHFCRNLTIPVLQNEMGVRCFVAT
jgi:hypothetical protein